MEVRSSFHSSIRPFETVFSLLTDANLDLHTRNLTFAVPSVQELSEDELMEKLGEPETGAVTRVDGGPLEDNVPRYLMYPAYLGLARSITAPVVKLIDFGESFTPSKKPETLHTPMVVRAPEVIFKDEFDRRADLWSMGCMVRLNSLPFI